MELTGQFTDKPKLPPAGPGGARPPNAIGEFKAKNLVSSSNDLQELFRK